MLSVAIRVIVAVGVFVLVMYLAKPATRLFGAILNGIAPRSRKVRKYGAKNQLAVANKARKAQGKELLSSVSNLNTWDLENIARSFVAKTRREAVNVAGIILPDLSPEGAAQLLSLPMPATGEPDSPRRLSDVPEERILEIARGLVSSAESADKAAGGAGVEAMANAVRRWLAEYREIEELKVWCLGPIRGNYEAVMRQARAIANPRAGETPERQEIARRVMDLPLLVLRKIEGKKGEKFWDEQFQLGLETYLRNLQPRAFPTADTWSLTDEQLLAAGAVFGRHSTDTFRAYAAVRKVEATMNVIAHVDQFIEDELYFERLHTRRLRRGEAIGPSDPVLDDKNVLPILLVAIGECESREPEHLRILQRVYDIKSTDLTAYFTSDGTLRLWKQVGTRYGDDLPFMSLRELKPDSGELTIKGSKGERIVRATMGAGAEPVIAEAAAGASN